MFKSCTRLEQKIEHKIINLILSGSKPHAEDPAAFLWYPIKTMIESFEAYCSEELAPHLPSFLFLSQWQWCFLIYDAIISFVLIQEQQQHSEYGCTIKRHYIHLGKIISLYC